MGMSGGEGGSCGGGKGKNKGSKRNRRPPPTAPGEPSSAVAGMGKGRTAAMEGGKEEEESRSLLEDSDAQERR